MPRTQKHGKDSQSQSDGESSSSSAPAPAAAESSLAASALAYIQSISGATWLKVAKFGLPFLVLFLCSGLSAADALTLTLARAFFALCTLAVLGAHGVIYQRIAARADVTIVRIEDKKAASGSRELSARNYDAEQSWEAVKTALKTAAISFALHLFLGNMLPVLLISGLNALMGLGESQLVAAHLQGRTDVVRPFPAADSMFDMLKRFQKAGDDEAPVASAAARETARANFAKSDSFPSSQARADAFREICVRAAAAARRA